MVDTTLDRMIAGLRAAYDDGSEEAVVLFSIGSRREAAELLVRLQAIREKKAAGGWRAVTRSDRKGDEQ